MRTGCLLRYGRTLRSGVLSIPPVTNVTSYPPTLRPRKRNTNRNNVTSETAENSHFREDVTAKGLVQQCYGQGWRFKSKNVTLLRDRIDGAMPCRARRSRRYLPTTATSTKGAAQGRRSGTGARARMVTVVTGRQIARPVETAERTANE